MGEPGEGGNTGTPLAGAGDALFRLVIEALPIGIVVMTRDGDVVHRNSAAAQIWGRVIARGMERWQLSRGRWRDTGVPVEPHEWASVRAIAEGVPHLDQMIDIEGFDGTQRTLRNSALPIHGASGVDGAIVVIEDITDRVRLEAELVQAQKLEAVGRLAGGIAHDFNNLLMVIFSYAGLMKPTFDATDPRSDDIVEILKAAESASALTGQLLAFGRRDVRRPRVVVLEDVVAETQTMLARVIGEHIQLGGRLANPGNRIWIDPLQLEQVILNLALNARDAMPEGGSLTISTATTTRARAGGSEPVAVLTVADTGTGIDDEVKRRIFEPFFTTKERGRGTGLGLAVVHGIVERSGGTISVTSKPGEGTRFDVELPITTAEPVTATVATRTPVPRAHADGSTVLLVEDAAAVRLAVRAMLSQLGYRVHDVADASAALAYVEGGGAVDLLLADLVLPGTNGRKLAEALAVHRPEVSVLFMSGYADDADLVADGTNAPILAKPFTRDALASAVIQALGG